MKRVRKCYRLLPLLGLLTALGCGLDEYQEKMKHTQKRLERFDEEQRLLDDPIGLPTRKVPDKSEKGEHEEPLAPIFLRPPVGIPTKASGLEHGILYRFARKTAAGAGAPPGTPPPAASSPFLDVCLAWESDKGDPKKFILNVLRFFPRKDAGAVPTPQTWEAPSTEPEKRAFETYEFIDPQEHYCSVSFRQRGKLQVAVAYRVEKGKRDAQTDRAVKCSLGTLALEDEVELAEKVYARIPRRSPPPAPAAPPAGQPPS